MRILVLRTACFVSIQTPNKLNIHMNFFSPTLRTPL